VTKRGWGRREGASQVAQWERICMPIQEAGRSPGEGNGNPSSFLAWRIPWTEEAGRL